MIVALTLAACGAAPTEPDQALADNEYAASAASRAELGVVGWSATERQDGVAIEGFDRSHAAVVSFRFDSTSPDESTGVTRYELRQNGKTFEQTIEAHASPDGATHELRFEGDSFEEHKRALELLASDLRARPTPGARSATSVKAFVEMAVVPTDVGIHPLDTPQLTEAQEEFFLTCPCREEHNDWAAANSEFPSDCSLGLHRTGDGYGTTVFSNQCTAWDHRRRDIFGIDQRCDDACQDAFGRREAAYEKYATCRRERC